MILASYTDTDGKKVDGLWYEWGQFFSDTFSPLCKIHKTIEFKLSGYSYSRKKAAARELAIEVQNAMNEMRLTWSELKWIEDYFYTIGSRFGLLGEFRENGIC